MNVPHFLHFLLHGLGLMLFTGLWLVPTWLLAVVIKRHAPKTCPDGLSSDRCADRCFPPHVLLGETWFAIFLGALWPLMFVLFVCRMFSKSVEVAAEINPPRPKINKTYLIGNQLEKETDAQMAKIVKDSQTDLDKQIDAKHKKPKLEYRDDYGYARVEDEDDGPFGLFPRRFDGDEESP